MMARVAALTRWEWFKLQRRWMPWIILAIILIFSQIPVWGGYFDYRGRVTGQVRITGSDGATVATGLTCADVRSGRMPDLPDDTAEYVAEGIRYRCRAETIAEVRSLFVLPASLTLPFGLGQTMAMLALAVLAASILGTDYSWGTLRTVIARGPGRWRYLAAKLLVLVLFTTAVWAIVAAATLVNSSLASALAPGPPQDVADWLVAHPVAWFDTTLIVAKALVAVLAYLGLAFFVTVLTTSVAAGIAISLGYYFVEGFGALLLIEVLHLSSVTDYLLVRNITAWMLGGADEDEMSSWLIRGPFGIGQYPSELHGLLVVLTYLMFFLALSFWLFRKRDIHGPRGE